MKASTIALFGLASTSNAAASDYFITNWTRMGTLLKTPDFYKGFILGLQEIDTDTDSLCYKSMEAMETVYLDLSAEGFELNTVRLVELSMDVVAEWYSMYNDCYFDNIMISLGKTVQTLPGALDTVMAFISNSLLEDTSDYASFLDTYETDGSELASGKLWGKFNKVFFNTEVPEATFTYTRSGLIFEKFGF